jgi:translation initiation factor IF-1
MSKKNITSLENSQSKQANQTLQKNKEQEVKGTVKKINQGSTKLEISLDIGHDITAYIAGKLRKNKIKILEGDYVTVIVSLHDIKRGRIIKRHKQSDIK